MKRFICVGIIIVMLLLCACGNQVVDEVSQSEQESMTEISTGLESESNAIESETQTEEKWAKIPMVMVEGQLYYATGKESTVEARCGVMDGEITSSVDGSETPTENNQNQS